MDFSSKNKEIVHQTLEFHVKALSEHGAGPHTVPTLERSAGSQRRGGMFSGEAGSPSVLCNRTLLIPKAVAAGLLENSRVHYFISENQDTHFSK